MPRKKAEKIDEEVVETVEVAVNRYNKQDILQSSKFDDIEKDFLYGCLPEGLYTVDEARVYLDNFLKGEVK